jgi:hypothetical protein
MSNRKRSRRDRRPKRESSVEPSFVLESGLKFESSLDVDGLGKLDWKVTKEMGDRGMAEGLTGAQMTAWAIKLAAREQFGLLVDVEVTTEGTAIDILGRVEDEDPANHYHLFVCQDRESYDMQLQVLLAIARDEPELCGNISVGVAVGRAVEINGSRTPWPWMIRAEMPPTAGCFHTGEDGDVEYLDGPGYHVVMLTDAWMATNSVDQAIPKIEGWLHDQESGDDGA